MPVLETERLLIRDAGADDRFAFDQQGQHRVYAQCRVENAASRRIMAKLGMPLEGVLLEDVLARGEWRSAVQRAILSTEWRG